MPNPGACFRKVLSLGCQCYRAIRLLGPPIYGKTQAIYCPCNLQSICGERLTKSIAEYVQSGISTLTELEDALQTAMQLEFSTIPPYLCAQWSINSNSDPSNVAGLIQNIVIQEMLHFALAGNMLNAIGRTPSIANARSSRAIRHIPCPAGYTSGMRSI